MTTPLRKTRTDERTEVALRRYKGKTGGLGFLSSRDYLMKINQLPEDKPRFVLGEDKLKRKPKKARVETE